MTKHSLFATLAASAALAAVPAQAQAQEAAAPAPAAQPAPAAPTDAEIRGFAASVVEINRIQAELQTRLEAAAPAEREAIEREASQRMATAVQSNGLDPERFNAIVQAARQDSALAQRIAALIQPQAERPGQDQSSQ